MSRLLVIGCGGVASVAIRKCCQNSDVFTEIMIASMPESMSDERKALLRGFVNLSVLGIIGIKRIILRFFIC